MLGGFQAGVAVGLQELQKIVALDEVNLARLTGFCSDFVRSTRDRCMHPQDFARLRNLQDQGLPFRRSGGKFYTTLTQHVYAAGRLPLHKEYCSRRIRRCVLDSVKHFENTLGKGAEKAVTAQLTDYAIVHQFKSVR